MRPSNMENANSPEYLEKIKIAVIENLKNTTPAPSVQMQDVPRHGYNVMTDDMDDELDDEDADNNKDVRVTQRDADKRTARDDEFEESDDEDAAAGVGIYKPNGKKRTITDFKNPYSVDGYEEEREREREALEREGTANEQNGSKHSTPQVDVAMDVDVEEGDETMEDVGAEAPEQPAPEVQNEPENVATPPTAPEAAPDNKEDDVEMAEAGEVEEAAPIKQEEPEPRPAETTVEPEPASVEEPKPEKPVEVVAENDAPTKSSSEEPKQSDPATVTTAAVEGEGTEKVSSPGKISDPVADNDSKGSIEEAAEVKNPEEAEPTPSGATGTET